MVLTKISAASGDENEQKGKKVGKKKRSVSCDQESSFRNAMTLTKIFNTDRAGSFLPVFSPILREYCASNEAN